MIFRQSWQDSVTEAMRKGGMGAEDAQNWILWRRELGRQQTAV
jgi:hypothetical protein